MSPIGSHDFWHLLAARSGTTTFWHLLAARLAQHHDFFRLLVTNAVVGSVQEHAEYQGRQETTIAIELKNLWCCTSMQVRMQKYCTSMQDIQMHRILVLFSHRRRLVANFPLN
jgi:hypothetical protein